MNDAILKLLRDLIQTTSAGAACVPIPERNLINACPTIFGRRAMHSPTMNRRMAMSRGFSSDRELPPAKPMARSEHLYLARAMVPLGIPVVLVTDDFCVPASKLALPNAASSADREAANSNRRKNMNRRRILALFRRTQKPCHADAPLAIERVGQVMATTAARRCAAETSPT